MVIEKQSDGTTNEYQMSVSECVAIATRIMCTRAESQEEVIALRNLIHLRISRTSQKALSRARWIERNQQLADRLTVTVFESGASNDTQK